MRKSHAALASYLVVLLWGFRTILPLRTLHTTLLGDLTNLLVTPYRLTHAPTVPTYSYALTMLLSLRLTTRLALAPYLLPYVPQSYLLQPVECQQCLSEDTSVSSLIQLTFNASTRAPNLSLHG
ncbi:hypothetical protein R3P38DRAFT_3261896 [Favolaschia claudopus]|uniref:Secreted protein n=1 Tax=Favolaschia claudopus TaxID=2862362 RepID=A0AAW0CK19_9AGAR